jgi:hypothetical protein
MDSNEVTALATVFGAAGTVGALIWLVWARRRDAKNKLTVSMYEEWSSKEMLGARQDAYRILTESRVPIDGNNLELRGEFDTLSSILHFFGRIDVLTRRRLINTKLLSELMGEDLPLWLTEYLVDSSLKPNRWFKGVRDSLRYNYPDRRPVARVSPATRSESSAPGCLPTALWLLLSALWLLHKQ